MGYLNHGTPEIQGALLTLYSGSKRAQGQYPLPPSSEEPGITDVWTRSQAVWIYLCAILQYFEDDMATWEGALYGGKTRKPSALVLYIMEHVNPGLPEPYWVHWHNIVGKTPWLAFRVCSGSIKSWNQTTPQSWKKPQKMCTIGQWRMRPSGKGLIGLFPHPVLMKLEPRMSRDNAIDKARHGKS